MTFVGDTIKADAVLEQPVTMNTGVYIVSSLDTQFSIAGKRRV